MAKKEYFGIAPLTVVKHKSDNTRAYVYAGQPIGDDVSKEEIARLEGEGFIAAIEVVAPVEEIVEEEVTGESAGTGNPDRPEPTSTKAEWVAYAVKVHEATDGQAGFAKEAAEEFTRAQLIEKLP